MNFELVPLQSVPSQSLQIGLGGQTITLKIYQKSTGLYVDVYLLNTLILAGVPCLNMTKIIRDAYLGVIGDLFFYDTQGVSDPDYTEMGSRYVLLYSAP